MRSTSIDYKPQNKPESGATPKQVVERVLNTGRITSADRDWFLRATLADTPLDDEEISEVRQVFDRLQMGLIRVVD